MQKQIQEQVFNSTRCIETDYNVGKEFELGEDSYNISIAVNMCNDATPMMITYSNKKILTIFGMQMCLGTLAYYDFRKLNNFQPIKIDLTFVRILFTTLLQKQVLSEL